MKLSGYTSAREDAVTLREDRQLKIQTNLIGSIHFEVFPKDITSFVVNEEKLFNP